MFEKANVDWPSSEQPSIGNIGGNGDDVIPGKGGGGGGNWVPDSDGSGGGGGISDRGGSGGGGGIPDMVGSGGGGGIPDRVGSGGGGGITDWVGSGGGGEIGDKVGSGGGGGISDSVGSGGGDGIFERFGNDERDCRGGGGGIAELSYSPKDVHVQQVTSGASNLLRRLLFGSEIQRSSVWPPSQKHALSVCVDIELWIGILAVFGFDISSNPFPNLNEGNDGLFVLEKVRLSLEKSKLWRRVFRFNCLISLFSSVWHPVECVLDVFLYMSNIVCELLLITSLIKCHMSLLKQYNILLLGAICRWHFLMFICYVYPFFNKKFLVIPYSYQTNKTN